MIKADYAVAGSGCAALYFALQVPKNKSVIIVTKGEVEMSDSFLAQGGICMLKDDDDYKSYFEDTMKAGHRENDPVSIEIMIKSSGEVIEDLIAYGVEFAKDEKGEFIFTREGGHSDKRILFHKDITGKEIMSKLLKKVKERNNITILEHTAMVDIIENTEGGCGGFVIRKKGCSPEVLLADKSFMATGGIGGLYKHSTNFRHLTGDAVAIALKHNIRTRNVNYIQVHPTTFYSENENDKRFLISESVRGEGAKLYGKDMKRFTNELLPRDLLTLEILKQMKKDGSKFVWEDLRDIPYEELCSHFPNIMAFCKEAGYDVTKECIPVVPAQHYFMGGVYVDYNSKTTMKNLYALGECACTGVHGKNRLASNSLLEVLVFAKRAAKDAVSDMKLPENKEIVSVDFSLYEDADRLEREYGKLIAEEIERLGGPLAARIAYRDKYENLAESNNSMEAAV